MFSYKRGQHLAQIMNLIKNTTNTGKVKKEKEDNPAAGFEPITWRVFYRCVSNGIMMFNKKVGNLLDSVKPAATPK